MKTLACVVVAALGCGGVVDGPLLDGGGTDATDASDGSSTGDGAPTCDSLLQQLAAEQTSATQCCVTCNVMQCSVHVDGLCCPLSVTNAGANAVKAYEATLAQIKAQHCSVLCPAIGCSTKPSDNCSQSGICVQ